MEDTHGGYQTEDGQKGYMGLNPYYNGRYSWSKSATKYMSNKKNVLILIIMEDTHGGNLYKKH